jgi:hypothetical protein
MCSLRPPVFSLTARASRGPEAASRTLLTRSMNPVERNCPEIDPIRRTD